MTLKLNQNIYQCGELYYYTIGERQDGAATGNGSAAVATLLPPDFHGATAGKHARIDGST